MASRHNPEELVHQATELVQQRLASAAQRVAVADEDLRSLTSNLRLEVAATAACGEPSTRTSACTKIDTDTNPCNKTKTVNRGDIDIIGVVDLDNLLDTVKEELGVLGGNVEDDELLGLSATVQIQLAATAKCCDSSTRTHTCTRVDSNTDPCGVNTKQDGRAPDVMPGLIDFDDLLQMVVDQHDR